MSSIATKTSALVSILTPCYNSENTICRLMDSILNQSYNNIEHIIIDDGSTDNTANLIKVYQKIYQKNNMDLIYIYQANSGQASAINKGLKLFKGEFLCWVDADDFLYKDSIYKRISFLINNPSYGSVSSDANMVKEGNIDKSIGLVNIFPTRFNKNQFIYLIMNKSCIYCNCHMIRSSCFIETNPKREIYCSKEGQNYQMLMPVYYKYPHAIIDEPLSSYVVNPNSHSHQKRNEMQMLNRSKELKNIIYKTLENMNITNKEKLYYMRKVHKFYLHEYCVCCIINKDKKLFYHFYKKLCNNSNKLIRNKFLELRILFPLIDKLYVIIWMKFRKQTKYKIIRIKRYITSKFL